MEDKAQIAEKKQEDLKEQTEVAETKPADGEGQAVKKKIQLTWLDKV